MPILGLLGIYFDALVVFVTKSSLFFRLAVAILCTVHSTQKYMKNSLFVSMVKIETVKSGLEMHILKKVLLYHYHLSTYFNKSAILLKYVHEIVECGYTLLKVPKYKYRKLFTPVANAN